jgi:hypothetical protein
MKSGELLGFGSEDRYYSDVFLRATKSSAQKAAEPTINRILADYQQDWREQVLRTFRQWNNILREYLRNETALRLTIGSEQQSVPVRVTDGLPEPFAEIVNDFNDPLIWKLYLNRSVIAESVKGIRFLEANARKISQIEIVPTTPETSQELAHVRDLFEGLNSYLTKLSLLERIQALNSDTLGAYFFRIPEIQLYWMVIGLMAGILNISVEALTVVTLTHELSHAYTHLGRDIDGDLWDTNSFAAADSRIIEGLAQFYTQVICGKLAARFPAASHAFDALLQMQCGPYVVHKDWTNEAERGGEIVRFAMIATRSRNLLKYDAWQGELDNARPQKGRSRRKVES